VYLARRVVLLLSFSSREINWPCTRRRVVNGKNVTRRDRIIAAPSNPQPVLRTTATRTKSDSKRRVKLTENGNAEFGRETTNCEADERYRAGRSAGRRSPGPNNRRS